MSLNPSVQIARRLRRGILDGRFGPNEKLPTIQTLAKTFNVSTRTIQKAVDELAAEGLIEPRRRVGMIVKPLPPQVGHGKRVGVVFPNRLAYLQGNPYPKEIFAEFQRGLARAGYSMLPCPIEELDRLVLLESLQKRQLAGMALFEIDHDVLVSELRELRLPTISIDYDVYRYGIGSVVLNNVRGMYMATKHLLGMGHTRLVMMRPLARSLVLKRKALDWTDEERVKGYMLAMDEAGLDADVREFENTAVSMRTELLRVLGRRPAPTGLVCVAGWSAQGMSKVVRELGYAIPRDLSVVAFGPPAKAEPGERVTTVDFDFKRMGREAARLMLERLKGGSARVERVVIQPALVELDTSAPPFDAEDREAVVGSGAAAKA